MIPAHHLDHFVARFMDRLPDSLVARKEDMVTLLALLPKDYEHRQQIREALEYIRAHELAQTKFLELLNIQPKGTTK